MGDLVRFPKTREVTESETIEGLSYASELKDIANALRAMEKMDEESRGFACAVGTIIPLSNEHMEHVGNLIKVEEMVWGFHFCTGEGCEDA